MCWTRWGEKEEKKGVDGLSLFGLWESWRKRNWLKQSQDLACIYCDLMWSMWKEEKKEMRGAPPYGRHICLTKYWIVKLLGHNLSYNSKSCWTWLTPFQNVSLWDVEKNLEYTQRLVWMGRNLILFQFVRLVRDLFQFNDLGILYTSNNQGNFRLK